MFFSFLPTFFFLVKKKVWWRWWESSWICSTLTEFRLRGFAPVSSICSLSGLATFSCVVRPQIRPSSERSFLLLNTPDIKKEVHKYLFFDIWVWWDCLAHSRLTAIPSCASRLCLSQNSPASARSRSNLKTANAVGVLVVI